MNQKTFIAAALVVVLATWARIGNMMASYAPFPGSVLYVSHNGSDSSGSGSEENPFRTLAWAAHEATPGTIIFVRGGTYNRTQESITAHGTASAPIIIQPYPGESVTFDGQGTGIGTSESILKINQSSYLILEGFAVCHSPARGVSVYESEHVTVRNNRIHDTMERGLGGSGEYLLFEGNEVWRASLENENEAFAAAGGWKAGLSTYKWSNGRSSRHITIRGNHIHDNWGEGIIAIFAEDVVIEGNEIHDNYSVNIYLDNARNVVVQGNHLYTTTNAYNRRDKGYPAYGVHMANEHYAAAPATQLRSVLVANNLITGTGRGISFWHDSRNSASDNSYQNISIVYNVIKDVHDQAIYFDNVPSGYTQPQGANLQNNIIFAGRNGRLLEIDNLDAWQFSHNNWPDRIPGLAAEPYTISVDPDFVDPRSDGPVLGFRLRAGSSSISAGLPLTVVTTDFWGQPRSSQHPSLGIFEFGADSEPPAFTSAVFLPIVKVAPTSSSAPAAMAP